MRNFIFEFDQNNLIKLGLNADDTLLLDYLVKFFGSGYAKCISVNGKKFFWITYKKMLEDLPMLNVKERQLRRIIVGLEQKGIIERHHINKNRLFMFINESKLFFDNDNGNCRLTEEDEKDIDDIPVGQEGLPIVRYYKNKIKILLKDARVKELNENDFLINLKQAIKPLMSDIGFGLVFKDSEVITISENLIILSASVTKILQDNPHKPFETALKQVLEKMLPNVTQGGSKSLQV